MITSRAEGFAARPTAIRKAELIAAPIDAVFDLLAHRMEQWWPRTHHIGPTDEYALVIEPFVGGRWYERSTDGTECDWGRVLAWEPPDRLLLRWSISPAWQYDPDLQTEVEMRLIAESATVTRVVLEHRGLERYGEHADEMRAIFESPRGWSGILASLHRAARDDIS